jgi:hypothetical protein
MGIADLRFGIAEWDHHSRGGAQARVTELLAAPKVRTESYWIA